MAELLWKRGTTTGKGEYGVVSLASTSNALFEGITLPSQIAVKSCNYHASQSLKEEEEFLSKFKHCPYIISCFGAIEDNVLLYNLMLVYASGGSLADCLRSCNSLPEIEVKKHTKNVLLGLSCIHSNGVIHCNIKPGNILLPGTDKTAKIADFGLSMTLEQCVKEKQERMIRVTKKYMAPELVRKSEYSPQTDVWALGCMVYELIMGTQMMIMCCTKSTKVSKFKAVEDFLRRCLVKNPSLRWTADMLLTHAFLLNSSKAVNNAKKRKRKK